MQIWVFVIFALIVLWLLAVWPGRGRKERMEDFSRQMIAHRGLHDNKTEAPENSLLAFRLAAEAGYGIELDVRETKDEALVICHDDGLKRVAGIKGKKISRMSLKDVRKVKLFQSQQTIPTFEEALEVIGGRVPVVVEIKSEDRKNCGRISAAVASVLDSYSGTTCIESFNPWVVSWFRKNRPQTLRGQLSEKFAKSTFPEKPLMFLFSCCFFNFATKPDFIAYRIANAGLMRFRLQHDLFHACCAGWTVRSLKDMENAAPVFDVMIFDGFTPPGHRSLVDRLKEIAGEAERAAEAGETNQEKQAGEAAKDAETGETNQEKQAGGTDKEAETGGADKPAEEGGSGKTADPGTSGKIRKHLTVHGDVTGVGFRYRAVNIAQMLGVTGWVRNVADSYVEMELQGKSRDLDEMVRRLQGQRFVNMTDIEEKTIPVISEEYEFKVRY